MRCEFCNTEIADDSKYCFSCGKEIQSKQFAMIRRMNQSLSEQDEKKKKLKKIFSICSLGALILVIAIIVTNNYYNTQTKRVRTFTESMLDEVNKGCYQNAIDLYTKSIQELSPRVLNKNNTRESIDALYHYACFMNALLNLTPQQMYDGDLSSISEYRSLCEQSLSYLDNSASNNFQAAVRAFEEPKMSINEIGSVVDDYYEKSFALLKLELDAYDMIYYKLRPIYEEGESYSIDELRVLRDEVYALIDSNEQIIIDYRDTYADICYYDAFPTPVVYGSIVLWSPFHDEFASSNVIDAMNHCFIKDIECTDFNYTSSLARYIVMNADPLYVYKSIQDGIREYVADEEKDLKKQFDDYSSSKKYGYSKTENMDGNLPSVVRIYTGKSRNEVIDNYNRLMTSWASGTFEEKDELMLWIYYNQNWVSAQKKLESICNVNINVRGQ